MCINRVKGETETIFVYREKKEKKREQHQYQIHRYTQITTNIHRERKQYTSADRSQIFLIV